MESKPKMHATKELIIKMLEEVEDGKTVRRYMSCSFTKEQMIREISEGTEEGNRFCTDLLRISRDILIGRSSRPQEPEPGLPAP